MTVAAGARVVVIGAGPAGLMAAEVLAAGGVAVTVYDRMPSAGRKFLMAGRGGLNLTHSENIEPFLKRYGVAESSLKPAINTFPPDALRAWSEALGQATFIGSSGRVFPSSFKASPLLRAWLRRLDAAGVTVRFRHAWTGWDAQGRLTFGTPDGPHATEADVTVLALGGGSWPRLGSDGTWQDTLRHAGVAVEQLRPSNCGFLVAWSEHFRERFAGTPLKGIELSFGNHSVVGEAMVTRDGIEGGAVYALSAALRDAIAEQGEATLVIRLRSDLSEEEIASRLNRPRGKQSLTNVLRRTLHLSPAAIGLLHEASLAQGRKLGELSPEALARLVTALSLRLTGTAPLERAIYSAGGVRFDQVDSALMLRAKPGVFVAGEMLDWEAPTGGYLLQGCFATGVQAGRGALEFLRRAA